MSSIIFYHPRSIVDKPVKGSEVRPKKMREAFKSIGFEIESVTGDSAERKNAINRIRKDIHGGKTYEFVYAESSNLPIPLADSHHLPLRPLQDYLFFRFLKHKSIPISLYYRDIYWQVNKLKKKVSVYKYLSKQLFHWLEWYGIRSTVDHLFLPTLSISKYLPTQWPKSRLSALPPGCTPALCSDSKKYIKLGNGELNLFYVGGVTPPYYDLSSMIKTVGQVSGLNLTLCCRKREWNKNAAFYEKFDFSNIKIIHAGSNEIGTYYRWADLVLDIRPSTGYFSTAMPIKIIEAIGYEVPVILLEGSEAATFVSTENTGWVVENESEAKSLLEKLKVDKQLILQKKQKIKEIKSAHTWSARASKVASIMGDLG